MIVMLLSKHPYKLQTKRLPISHCDTSCNTVPYQYDKGLDPQQTQG